MFPPRVALILKAMEHPTCTLDRWGQAMTVLCHRALLSPRKPLPWERELAEGPSPLLNLLNEASPEQAALIPHKARAELLNNKDAELRLAAIRAFSRTQLPAETLHKGAGQGCAVPSPMER